MPDQFIALLVDLQHGSSIPLTDAKLGRGMTTQSPPLAGAQLTLPGFCNAVKHRGL